MILGDNYVTGDNIYLRELQNFFFEVLGMMSITHYGAIGDGRRDNYGPLQVAIDDANRRGLSYIYVPYGRFIYTGELINRNEIKFVGNPHSHIVNIRTGAEIPIEQFGIPTSSNYYTAEEIDSMLSVLENNIYSKSEIDNMLSLLPEDYYELEKIGSKYVQYITTKINEQPNIRLEAKIKFTEVDQQDQNVFGDHYGDENMSLGVSTTRGWYTVIKRSPTYSDVMPDTNTEYEIEFFVGGDSQILKINGVDVISTSQEISTVSNTNLFLFARNETTLAPASMSLYYAKLYVDGELVRDFVPAKRKIDSEVGLYDRVSGLFFTNIGTSEFIAGNIVENHV